MRWAFWRKEPQEQPPPRQPTRRYPRSADKPASAPPPQPEPEEEPNFDEIPPQVEEQVQEEAAAQEEETAPPPEPAKPAEAPAGASQKERIGEMLLKRGFITKDALSKALETQKALRQDTYLGEILVRDQTVTEEQLASTISRQYKIPYLRFDTVEIKPEVLALLSPDEARRLRVVPIDRLGRILSVAMANPLDEAGLAELQASTGLKIKPLIALTSDIKKALDRYFPAGRKSNAPSPRSHEPAPVRVPPTSERATKDPSGPPSTPASTSRLPAVRAPEPSRTPSIVSNAPTVRPTTGRMQAVGSRAPAVAASAAEQAQPVPEDVFLEAVSNNPEHILRLAQPQGVRRRAVPAALITDAEFVLFVGSLPRK